MHRWEKSELIQVAEQKKKGWGITKNNISKSSKSNISIKKVTKNMITEKKKKIVKRNTCGRSWLIYCCSYK